MTDAPSRLRSVTLLAQDAHRYAAALLGPEVRAGLPIPLGGRPRYAFLLCRAEVVRAGEAPSLFPPRFVATLSASDGLVLSIRRTRPVELGQDVPEDRPIGNERPPDERLSDEHLTSLARVHQALDRVAPAFFGVAPVSDDERRAFVASYLSAFDAAVEPALLPFRRALERDFDAWLGRA